MGASSDRPPRGTRPDAIRGRTYYLLKNVSLLHLTYQIKLLTFMAAKAGGMVIIRVPQKCSPSPKLSDFLAQNSTHIRMEKT